jgi:hypothetical protein
MRQLTASEQWKRRRRQHVLPNQYGAALILFWETDVGFFEEVAIVGWIVDYDKEAPEEHCAYPVTAEDNRGAAAECLIERLPDGRTRYLFVEDRSFDDREKAIAYGLERAAQARADRAARK